MSVCRPLTAKWRRCRSPGFSSSSAPQLKLEARLACCRSCRLMRLNNVRQMRLTRHIYLHLTCHEALEGFEARKLRLCKMHEFSRELLCSRVCNESRSVVRESSPIVYVGSLGAVDGGPSVPVLQEIDRMLTSFAVRTLVATMSTEESQLVPMCRNKANIACSTLM